MFEFGKRIFGRKGVAPGQEGAPSPRDLSYGFGLTFDAVMARCMALTGDRAHSPVIHLDSVVCALSTEERTELFASVLAEVDVMASPDGVRSDDRRNRLGRCFSACLKFDMAMRKEHLPALIEALTSLSCFTSTYSVDDNRRMLSLMRAAIKGGGFFTTSDLERLGEFAERLRGLAEKQYGKPNKKTLIARADAIEKLAGIEVSATSVLLERAEGADNPHAMGEKPANYEFWAALLAAVVYGLDEIEQAVRDKGKPGWMTDPAVFAETWPAVGPIAPSFGEWTRCEREEARNFAPLKKAARQKVRRALPEDLLDLPGQRDWMEPWYRYDWSTPQIPALDVLADLENSDWTAFAEHLVTARMAPRPTKAWVKEGLARAAKIGVEAVEQRLHAWLETFHYTHATPETIARAANCYDMDNTAAHLNEKLPDWPVLIAPEEIGPAGRALAMQMASESTERLLAPLSVSLLMCDDQRFHESPKWFASGTLRIRAPRTNPGYRANHVWAILGWLRMSVENEQILRGALWMLAAMPDRAAAITGLERIALSAGAPLWNSGEDQLRSKVIANAAIAMLIDMGGADVNPVLLRLSREIENRTVNAALFKALNA